jgi:anti-sigma-K factor RskA
MTADPMTLERFRAIVAAYGANPARWPAAERRACESLVAVSVEAQALVGEALRLDAVLDALPAARPTPAIRAAILAAAHAAPPPSRLREAWREIFGDLGGWRTAGAALAASLLLGIVSGGLLSEGLAPESSPSLLQLALLDDDFSEFEP